MFGSSLTSRLLSAVVVLQCVWIVAGGNGDGKDFFDQAKRSIKHDKNVLAKLESHPLAHASGWNIRETQGSNKGWSEKATSTGPRLGGQAWQKKNQALEGELQRMSDSVNVMFKDQGDKRKYQRDEDKLFKEAVSALRTADELYPDKPGAGRAPHADSNFAAGGGGFNGKLRARQSMAPLPRPPRSRSAKNFRPNITEVFLILSGCTMLAAAGWIGFTFFRRKSYYDLRHGRSRNDEPEGIEVP